MSIHRSKWEKVTHCDVLLFIARLGASKLAAAARFSISFMHELRLWESHIKTKGITLNEHRFVNKYELLLHYKWAMSCNVSILLAASMHTMFAKDSRVDPSNIDRNIEGPNMQIGSFEILQSKQTILCETEPPLIKTAALGVVGDCLPYWKIFLQLSRSSASRLGTHCE